MSYSGKLRLHPLAIAVCLSVTQIGYADEVQVDAKEAIELGRILVKAQPEGENGDAQGYDDVYSRDMSSVYRGKEEIERFKGKSPADILKGMTGVFSGDSRNSGSIDVNIRGIQGQGRVPVTIDGTEQGITVYRGYLGASNRNYLDPSLISSITIEKGGTLSTDVKTSVGGGVAMKTINIDDVVALDQRFGVDYQIETSTNTTRPRLPDLSPIGKDYRDDITQQTQQFWTHPNIIREPKSRSGSADFFNMRDGAARIAAGYRGEIFDLMAAVSYRKQGNYFSGKNGASGYYTENAADHIFMANVADTFKPGAEILNTSSTNRSFLLKNTWYISDDQRLLLSARHSLIEHGEIMPSRIIRYEDGAIQQWPTSKINQRAYNAEYRWKPEDNPWIDAKIQVWKTTTNSNTYTGDGFVFDLATQDWNWNFCRNVNLGNTEVCDRDNEFHPYKNNALAHARDNRWGVTASNTMEIMDNLKFTAGIDYQREKLRSETNTREGRRRSTNLMFNFEWQPIPSVTINAGVKRNSYSSFDDKLAEGRHRQDHNYQRLGPSAHTMQTYRTMGQDEYDYYRKTDDMLNSFSNEERIQWIADNPDGWDQYAELKNSVNNPFANQKGRLKEDFIYSQREDGRYYREDNPYLNGMMSKEKVVNPVTGELEEKYQYYGLGTHFPEYTGNKFSPVKRQSGHAWSPILSVGWDMTDYSKVYARYAEEKRFPSMFESTVGFTTTVRDQVTIKPEKSRNIEIGYVYDLSWLPNTEASDFKISYYDNKMNDVIERDKDMHVVQIDELRTKGIEVQARYSTGKYYGSLGINYNLKNKACDESASMGLNPLGDFPSCVDGGFPIGYLRTHMVPKYSINLNIGGKFFGDRLEVGTNLNYHSKARNRQEEQMMKDGLIITGNTNNNPIRWNSAFLVDAYLSYKIDKDLTINFSGHNLTNQYYIDPLTRSFMPAPGRTFRIGFQGKL